MKKITSLIFALAMILSIVFIGELTSSENPYSAQAQVTVEKKTQRRRSRRRKICLPQSRQRHALRLS